MSGGFIPAVRGVRRDEPGGSRDGASLSGPFHCVGWQIAEVYATPTPVRWAKRSRASSAIL
jgi:hypothetical protein